MDKNCLNCEKFTWWDNDYCCTKDFTILCESDKFGNFTEDILKTMKTSDTCKNWKKNKSDFYVKMYKEKFDKFWTDRDQLV